MNKDTVGPKPLTIEEYRKRTRPPQIEKPLSIPKVKPPKRRGGFIVQKRRELANIKRIINSSPPPPWDLACRYWLKIEEIENIIETHIKLNK